MIGAAVFVICFVLFTVISLVISLPPGLMILETLVPDILATDYASWVIGIINGVIYGVIIWVVFSLVMLVYNRRKGPPKIVVETKTTK